VVRGRLVRPRRPRRGRGRKKSRRHHPDEPADHALGRSRGGFGTKFHLVTDGRGTPLAIELTAGQVHESTRAESVVGHAVATLIGRRRQKRRRRHKPRKLAGDKGYSVQRVRDWLSGQKIEPVIPHKDNEKARHDPAVWFDRLAYRGRCVVEQCVGWLKEFRRIGTRFEKLAVHFHGMLQLAMIRRYLKLLFSDRA
jgi:transposase